MYILLFIFALSSAFACQSDQISIVRRTGISINNNGNHSGTATQKVNMPVKFEGNWGCWEQEGGLSFDVKEKKKSLTVIIPKSSFEKIPGRTVSYAALRRDSGILEMDIATFVCLGSTVVASETFSGTILDAMVLQSMDVQVSTIFATGIAAQNLQRADRRKQDMPGALQEYFERNFHGQWSQLERYDVMVPSVYLGSSMKTPLSNLTSTYNTRVVTKSACSPEFELIMSPLRFENLRLPDGLKAKVKKGNLQITW